MIILSPAEQEYLRQIYLFCKREEKISTNSLALLVNTKPASVTDMLQKLAKKGLIIYIKYYGCSLSMSGKMEALNIVRKRVLWEILLVRKLGLDKQEAGAIAAQMQSISSQELIDKLSIFLDYPRHDIRGEILL
ncbi:metal-dependent transcriptional regulator [Flavobacterium sp. 102]|jgi:DtxR family Mn-dependent transcriptional regulator|uniref:metal-dependent transcriptional regulator n=1 Tax=Flavobacterium sp. 102 TaxID=2135623 RepID=UPI000EB0D301|nr:metal-dependent transcriptional regulator [Flavobacterium sp. 102]RKS03416.1 DtxR family iron (metal) dependent repressor [Flavobacterium sp. 102]|eukprot:Opistho-2@22348